MMFAARWVRTPLNCPQRNEYRAVSKGALVEIHDDCEKWDVEAGYLSDQDALLAEHDT